ncbi:hypothetical protein ACFL96_16970 [Thermoproteota archaeon]
MNKFINFPITRGREKKGMCYFIAFFTLLFLFILPLISIGVDRSYYQEVTEPGIKYALQSMAAHQIQMTNFAQYTNNLHTPGYVESGCYNVRNKDGSVEAKPYYRWRNAPGTVTNRALDFYCDSQMRGFFTIKLPGGNLGYTRDGRFDLDSQNRLVTLAGDFPVMGEGGEIYVPQGTSITSAANGMLFADSDPIDKLRISVFTDDGRDELVTLNGAIFVVNGGRPKLLIGEEYYKIRQYEVEENSVLKSLIGDVALSRYPYYASIKVTKSIVKTINSAIQLGNP